VFGLTVLTFDFELYFLYKDFDFGLCLPNKILEERSVVKNLSIS